MGCACLLHTALDCQILTSAGANVWPGANLVVQDTGAKFVLKYQDRTRWVEKLKVRCRALPCTAEPCVLRLAQASQHLLTNPLGFAMRHNR